MDSEDWIKYVTEKFVDYVDTPKETRKQNRQLQKKGKESWVTRWFGMPGMSMLLWFRGLKR